MDDEPVNQQVGSQGGIRISESLHHMELFTDGNSLLFALCSRFAAAQLLSIGDLIARLLPPANALTCSHVPRRLEA